MAGNRVWRCHYCKNTLPFDTFKKNRLCPTCGSDLHACRNCAHYDENLSSKCKEPHTEWVSDRTGHNDCTYFEMRQVKPGESAETTSAEVLSEAERAKEAFRQLFRNVR